MGKGAWLRPPLSLGGGGAAGLLHRVFIAPRPFLAINGDTDPRTPVPGLELCATAARAAYRAAGAEENFTLTIQPKTGHKVNPESLLAAREWLVRRLKP